MKSYNEQLGWNDGARESGEDRKGGKVLSAIVLVITQLLSLGFWILAAGAIELLGVFGACPDCAKNEISSLSWYPSAVLLCTVIAWALWSFRGYLLAVLVSALPLLVMIF